MGCHSKWKYMASSVVLEFSIRESSWMGSGYCMWWVGASLFSCLRAQGALVGLISFHLKHSVNPIHHVKSIAVFSLILQSTDTYSRPNPTPLLCFSTAAFRHQLNKFPLFQWNIQSWTRWALNWNCLPRAATPSSLAASFPGLGRGASWKQTGEMEVMSCDIKKLLLWACVRWDKTVPCPRQMRIDCTRCGVGISFFPFVLHLGLILTQGGEYIKRPCWW